MDSIKLLDKKQALEKLKSIGIKIRERQIHRAASPNDLGIRKLPFFQDPITGKLVIDENVLINAYTSAQTAALKEYERQK